MAAQVKDTGIGIPPEFKERAFTSFHQAAPCRTRDHGGTGLGLAISARLASLMDAKLWFDSTEGVGTTLYFNVTLPWQELARVEPLTRCESSNSLSTVRSSSTNSGEASIHDAGNEARIPPTGTEARIPPTDLPNLAGCYALVDHPSEALQSQLVAACTALGLVAVSGDCEIPPSKLQDQPPRVLVVATTRVAAALRAGWKGHPVVSIGAVADVPQVMRLLIHAVPSPVKQRVLAQALQVALKVRSFLSLYTCVETTNVHRTTVFQKMCYLFLKQHSKALTPHHCSIQITLNITDPNTMYDAYQTSKRAEN